MPNAGGNFPLLSTFLYMSFHRPSSLFASPSHHSYLRSSLVPSLFCPGLESLVDCLQSGQLPVMQVSTFTLCQLHLSPLTLESVAVILRVQSHCSWMLSVGGSELTPHNCQLVAGLDSTSRSVVAVEELLSILDSSVFCVGNPVEKFKWLIDHHNDGFKDQTGK